MKNLFLINLMISLVVATRVFANPPVQERENLYRICDSTENCGPGYECKDADPSLNINFGEFAVHRRICTSSGAKTSNQSCTLGGSDCQTGLVCMPLETPTMVEGQFVAKTAGGCVQCVKGGQSCNTSSMNKACCPGLACLGRPGQNSGTCLVLQGIPDNEVQDYGFVQPHAINLRCSYLPGTFYFFSENDPACCGIGTAVALEGQTTPQSWLRYCNMVPAGHEKVVTDSRFCAPSADSGGVVMWEGSFGSGSGRAEYTGRCINPPSMSMFDFPVGTPPAPEFVFNQALCQANFKPEDKSDFEGLASLWPATAYYPYWESSWPASNIHRVGDEMYLMSFMWLHKNTTVDSLHGLNFKFREFAGKLYDSYDKYYSKSIIDSYEWIKLLERDKECIEPSSPFAFQLRYLINQNLIEGLTGTLLSYLCGGHDQFDLQTGACKTEVFKHFATDFILMQDMATREANDCSSVPYEAMPGIAALAAVGDPNSIWMLAYVAAIGGPKDCDINIGITSWKDGKRWELIKSAYDAEFPAGDNGNVKGKLENMGIDYLIDPAVNQTWAPQNFLDGKIEDLFRVAKSKTKSELTALNMGSMPVFHWSMILKQDKFNEAFPDTSINGRRFLHIHEKMSFISNNEKSIYQTAFAAVPTDPSELINQNTWNGPETIATESVHLMESLAMADEWLWQRLRHLRNVYPDQVLKVRLARLMLYYEKKLEGLILENECLHAQITSIAETMGHKAGTFDIQQISFKKESKCGTKDNAASDSGDNLGIKADSLKAELVTTTGSGPAEILQDQAGNNTGIGGFSIIGGSNANTGLSKSKPGSSQSNIRGPLTSLNGNGSALNKAARKGMKDFLSLVKKGHGEYVAEHGSHPAVAAALNSFPASGRLKSGKGGASGTPLGLAAGAGGGSSGPDKTIDFSKAGSLKDSVQFSEGTVDFTGAAAGPQGASKSGAATTGLKPDEEKHILNNINPSSLTIKEGDSLWTIINKTYIKSYKKLFDANK